jgi:formate dehydrogenase subunit gamma
MKTASHKGPDPVRRARASAGTAGGSEKIFRFRESERWVHWALAIPFVVLYASAIAMFALGNEPQPRHFRTLFAWIHRGAGIGLIVLPPLTLLAGMADWRTHLSNLRHAWSWDANDIRWLLLAPRAAVNPKITLPEQGKFNAAEKLNFMVLTATYPLYIVTGLMVWMPGIAFFSWIAHIAMAVMGFPLVAGHIFMAAINPSTRIGLEGMFTGWVDREWAKHHYRIWYREHFEKDDAGGLPRRPVEVLDQPAAVRCDSCKELYRFESWEHLLQRIFQVEPLFCPRCRNEITIVSVEADFGVATAMLSHLDRGRGEQPFEPESRAA